MEVADHGVRLRLAHGAEAVVHLAALEVVEEQAVRVTVVDAAELQRVRLQPVAEALLGLVVHLHAGALAVGTNHVAHAAIEARHVDHIADHVGQRLRGGAGRRLHAAADEARASARPELLTTFSLK